MHFVKAAVVATAVVSGQQCYQLTDTDAPLRAIEGVIQAAFPDFSYDGFLSTGMGQSLNLLPADLQTCLASYDGAQISALLDLIVSAGCMDLDEQLLQLAQVQALLANFPRDIVSLEDLMAKAPVFLQFLLDTPNSDFRAVCAPLTSTLPTCVSSVLPPFFASVQDHSNGCCAPVLDALTAATGERPSVLLPDLLQKTVDLACAARTPGFPSLASQSCGYTATQVFARPDAFIEMLVEDTMHVLSIPNEQGCRAVLGQRFNTTVPGNPSVRFNRDGKTMDSCAVPIETLIAKFAAMPFVADSGFRALFADGACYAMTEERVAVVVAWIDALAIQDFSGALASMMLNLPGRCFHLPSGYSDTCAFLSNVA